MYACCILWATLILSTALWQRESKTERLKQGNGESASKVECSFYLHIKGNLYFSTKEILWHRIFLLRAQLRFFSSDVSSAQLTNSVEQRILFEKLSLAACPKEMLTFHKNRRFIIVLMRVLNWSMYYSKKDIWSRYSYTVSYDLKSRIRFVKFYWFTFMQ